MAARAGLHGTVAQSSAQVIDGSLNFFQGSLVGGISNNPYLHRTPSSSGNRSTWTISCWVKPSTFSNSYMPITMATNDYMSWEYEGLFWWVNQLYYIDYKNQATGGSLLWQTKAVYRDNAWYHVMAVKVNNNIFKLYVNGEEITILDASTNLGNQSTWWNVANQPMYVGGYMDKSSYSGYSPRSLLSQFYFIDGMALDPFYFGYTDPLTNTWRPKKYTGPSMLSGEGDGDQATNAEYTDNVLGFYFNGASSGQQIFLGRIGGTDYCDDVTFGSHTGSVISTGDTMMWAYDESSAKLWCGRNGTWYGAGNPNPATGIDPTFAGFPTDKLLFKTLYYEDAGVANNSSLYLTNIVEGSKSYSIPTGYTYWSAMDGNWEQSGTGQSSTTRPDYIAQKPKGKIYWETTVTWTGTGAWSDYREFGLTDVGNGNTNTFYLPFDGNTPIGKDLSGNENDFISENCGSNVIDKATGAFPILNTVNGGNWATSGIKKEVGPNTPEIVKKSGCSVFTEFNASLPIGGSYLEVPDHPDLELGNGDYTIECWVYIKSPASSYHIIFRKSNTYPDADYAPYGLAINNGAFLYSSSSNGTSYDIVSNATSFGLYTPCEWVHVAVVKNGNTITGYCNGVGTQLATGVTATVYNNSLPFCIGSVATGNGYDFNGFISNFRLVKGSAVYTNNFTPPTEPLTAVTNTKLLGCQSNTTASDFAVAPTSGFNNGTVWSSYCSTTKGPKGPQDFYSYFGPYLMFDGALTTDGCYGGFGIYGGNDSDLIFKPPSGIVGITTLEVYAGYYDKIKVNGDDYNTGGESTASQWVTVNDGTSNFSGTLNELVLENTTNANVVRCAGIRLGDSNDNTYILTDPVIVRGDARASDNELMGSCALALPLVGIASDYSSSINGKNAAKWLSSYSDPLTIEVNGPPTFSSINYNNTGYGKTTVGSFYGNSLYFDGTGDYLKSSYGSGGELKFGTCDFTMECWINSTAPPTSTNTEYVIHILGNVGNKYLSIYRDSTSQLHFQMNGTGGIDYDAGWRVFGTKRWYHLAMVRKGSLLMGFVDGVNVMTNNTISIDFDETQYLAYIGAGGISDEFDGYIQDVRVYTGVAKYTKNFIPASTNPDIVLDTPSGVSLGSNLTKLSDITDNGSVVFNGSNNSLFTKDSSDYDFGSGDFTMEAFVYTRDDGTDRSIIQKYITNAANSQWQWRVKAGQWQQFDFYYSGSSARVLSGYQHAYFPSDCWVHCAVTRYGDTLRLFQDGKCIATGDVSNDSMNSTSVECYIGEDASNADDMLGSISNVRITKGTALYTKDFTPPTEPLTTTSQGAIESEVKLLCCQSNSQAGAAVTSPSIRYFNDGTLWSSYCSTTKGAHSQEWNGGNGPYLMFTGDASPNTLCWGGENGSESDIIFSPPSGITGITRLDVFVGYYDKIKVNGNDFNTAAGADTPAWVTVNDGTSDFSGTLNELVLENTTNGNVVRCSAIRLEGMGVQYLYLTDPLSKWTDVKAQSFNPFTNDTVAPNVVRGTSTDYCTFNQLRERSELYNPTFSDGNLFMDGRGDGTGTISASSGKFYFEVLVDTVIPYVAPNIGAGQIYIGVQDADYSGAERNWASSQYAALRDTGSLEGDGKTGSGVVYGQGDVLSIAFDADNNKLYIAKNGVYLNNGNPSKGTGFTHSGINFVGGYTIMVSDSHTGQKYRLNCGKNPFTYVPPEGFQPFSVANLPSPGFVRPDQHVGVTTYAGNGTAVSVSSYNFAPDFIWLKGYTDADRHGLYDKVRGVKERLQSSEIVIEDTVNGVMTFDPNGFSVGDYSDTNGVDRGYVAWCWKAGGGKGAGEFWKDDKQYASAADAGLDDGTLTVTGASVGTKQGFSIIQFTGDAVAGNVSHGLTQEPDFIIAKNIDGTANDWPVWHTDLTQSPNPYTMYLNGPAAQANEPLIWPSQFPVSLISIGSGSIINENTISTILYSWHNVPGLQKFGKYVGNTEDNGPFIDLGFEPAIIMIKNRDITTGANPTQDTDWMIYDNVRDKSNAGYKCLYPNLQNSQGVISNDSCWFDILSNGFKLRNNDVRTNLSHTYIYAAWAYQPLHNLYGAQSNAR